MFLTDVAFFLESSSFGFGVVDLMGTAYIFREIFDIA